MAFRASIATQESGLQQAMSNALWIRSVCTTYANQLAAGSVTSDDVFRIADDLARAISGFQGVAAIPGIGAYAQAQFNDATYDVVPEFNNMVAAIQAALTWIVTNFPKDTQGFAQAYTLAANGSRTPAAFTSAQTAGLATALQAAAASIS